VPLNGKQRRQLRALGHHLEAVVQIGANGVTPGVIAAARQALQDHELVKVKIADERDGRVAALDALVEGTGAELAQTLGRTALLYKKRAKNSKLKLVGDSTPAEQKAPAPKKKRKTPASSPSR
jgi:RNA-binding protein